MNNRELEIADIIRTKCIEPGLFTKRFFCEQGEVIKAMEASISAIQSLDLERVIKETEE